MKNILPLAILLLSGAGCGRTALNDFGGTSSRGGATGAGGATSTGGTRSACEGRIPSHHRQAGTTCPQERGSGSVYANTCQPGIVANPCAQDADCKEGTNGRCVPAFRLDCAGQCRYDGCFGDPDCPAGQPCACRASAADSAANSCLTGGNCRTDGDCGPCGFCSPSLVGIFCGCTSEAFCKPDAGACYVGDSREPSGWRPVPCSCGDSCGHAYFCHTPRDTCVDDSDCTGNSTCNFDLPSQTWTCSWCWPFP